MKNSIRWILPFVVTLMIVLALVAVPLATHAAAPVIQHLSGSPNTYIYWWPH